MTSSTRHLLWLLVAALLIFSTGRSTAQTWNGGGIDGNWSTPGNWTGGVPANPSPAAGTADVFFDGTLQLTNTIDVAWNINTLTFNPTAGAFVIGGSLLTLEVGITNNSTAIQTITAPLQLGAGTRPGNTFFTGAGGTLVLGAIDWVGDALMVDGAGNTFFGGVGTDSVLGGSLTKRGTGTLTMTNANAYDGGTTIDVGVVNIQNGAALGTAGGGTTVTATGAALELQGGITVSAEPLWLNGTGVGGNGALRSVSGTNVWSNTVRLQSSSSVGVDADALTLSGIINDGGGAFGLTKVGAGALTLSGAAANTYTGMTTVNAGLLMLSKTAGVNAFGGGLTIGDGVGGLNADIVRLGASNQIPGAVTILNSGWLDLNNFLDTITTLTMTGGNITTGGGTLTLGGNVVGNADPNTATISGNLDLGAATRTFTIASGTASPDMSISAIISNGSVTKAGTGNLLLSGTNLYAGATLVNAGTLTIGANNALGTAAAGTTVANGATLGIQGGISYTTAEAVTINGTGVGGVGAINNVSGTNSFVGAITLASASTIGTAAGQLTLSGNIGGNFALTVTNAPNTTAVLSGVRSGTGGLVKNGTGTLILSGVNTYSGATTIRNGVLIVTTNNALGTVGGATTVSTGGTLGFASNINYTAAEPVTINGAGFGGVGAINNVSGTNSFAGAITLASASTLGTTADQLTLGGTINNGGFLMTVTNAAGTALVSTNMISGTGGLTKNGSGTLILGGVASNIYSGVTTVNNGTLQLNKTAGINAIAGNLTVGDGVGAANSAVVQLMAANQIVNTSAVSINGDGLLSLNGFADTIGTLTMTGGNVTTGTGTLTLGGNVTGNASASQATISGNLNLGAATRTFTIANGAADPDMVISAIISNGGVTKAGAGNLLLSGTNLYAGATLVNAGTLTIGANNALGTAAAGTTVANGATLGIQGGISYTTAEAVTINGVGVGGVGAINNVSGTNSFAGAITLASASTIGTTADQLTLSGNMSGNFLLTVTNAPGTTAVLTGVRSGTGGLTKNGAGTLTLSGAAANTFSGATTVNAGTLNLASAGALGSTSSVTLNTGGTLLLSGTPTADRINNAAGLALAGGTLSQNGATETMGVLTLTANSVINLGAAGGLTFANTTWTPGTSTLAINGWTGTMGVGGASTGATLSFSSTMSGQVLNNINFVGYSWGGYVLSTGEIIPVPEPASILAGLLLVVLLGWQTLRRFFPAV